MTPVGIRVYIIGWRTVLGWEVLRGLQALGVHDKNDGKINRDSRLGFFVSTQSVTVLHRL